MEQIDAIHNAAARGDLSDVKELVRVKGPHSRTSNLAQTLDENGRLPLHLAAWYGNTAVVQLLTERYPAGVHVLDKDDRAPHHYAAMSNKKSAETNYKYLIDKGGDKNAKDIRGNVGSYYLNHPADESRPPTPKKGERPNRNNIGDGRNDDHGRRSTRGSTSSIKQSDAAGDGISMEEVERMLLTGRGGELREVRSSDPDVQELLDSVPYIMEKIESAHRAAEQGDIRDVQSQLDRRKLAGSTLKDGATPLHRAAFMGHSSVIRFLAQSFPDTMETPDRNGRTALHYAAGSRDGGHAYKLLLREGASETATDKRGREPPDYLRLRGALRYTSVDQQTDDYADTDEEDNGITESRRTHRKPQKQAPRHGRGRKRSRAPATEQGKYLMRELGQPLTAAMKVVSKQKPADPIGHLALLLYQHAANQKWESEELCASPKDRDNGGSKDASSERDSRADEDNILKRDHLGRSILHFAAAQPHSGSAFRRLLDQSDFSIADRDHQFRTVRDVAERTGNADNVAAVDDWVATLAANGDTQALQQLLLSGYHHILQARDTQHRTGSALAERGQHADTLDLLQGVESFQEKRRRLFAAVGRGSEADVHSLLDDSRLAWSREEHGRLPLHSAVLGQNSAVVELLASKYPHTVDLGDNLERTPMHYAMAMDSAETMGKILIDAGASRQKKDLGGRTPSYFLMHPELLDEYLAQEVKR